MEMYIKQKSFGNVEASSEPKAIRGIGVFASNVLITGTMVKKTNKTVKEGRDT